MSPNLKEESLKKKVIIKWRAYVKMLKHVLRFGSNAKPKGQYKEVMGMLIGYLADQPGLIKDVIIEDAVPISHGGHIEVAFKPEDYGSFSIIDSQYADKGWFTVGWYHSHPGLSCFFSAVDIRNQMGWQGPNNSAVGIVWDHTRFETMEGDMGFEVYRLDDPQNPMSDYHKVNWVVEPPDDPAFYFEGIVELINNIKKGEPPILELNEVPDVFGDFEVPGQSELMSKEPEIEFKQVEESLVGGIEKISEIFIKPLIEYVNEWARSVTQGITSKNVIMLQNLKGLRENLSKSMGDLQSWFKFALNDALRNIWVEIDDKYDADVETRKRLYKKMEELSSNLDKTLSDAFDKALANVIADILKKISKSVELLTEAEKSSEEISNTSISQKARLEATTNSYKEKVGEIKNNSLLIAKDTSDAIKTALSPASQKIDSLQKKLTDIKTSLKALEGMIK
ncbi:MAG: Mov34/MPN/PAD-1 family protein [Promethearchaeota archaeon]